jgi:hypothetical protein
VHQILFKTTQNEFSNNLNLKSMKKLLILCLLMSVFSNGFSQIAFLDGTSCEGNTIKVFGWSRSSSGNFEPLKVYVDGSLVATISTSNVQRQDVLDFYGGVGTNNLGFAFFLDQCYSNGNNREIRVQFASNNANINGSPTYKICTGATSACTGGGGPGPGPGPTTTTDSWSDAGNGNIKRASGKVWIGDDSPNFAGNYALYVKTGILTEKLKVGVKDTGNWSDFVFEKNYKLPKLSEVEKFVKEQKHLPSIPSATEVVKDGLDVSEISSKLLQKIEELTLYVIEQDKRLRKIETQNTKHSKAKR